ncbi:MAG: DUF4382 domain-containing protein [Thaumarchaeota archaeon]|jgi:hypothetical protein|nr:DUF4382 domain-containing protein [Nitrososphaerota archaeon]
MNRNLVITISVIAILVVAGIAYELYPYYTKQTTPVSTTASVTFPIALTDPPSVPTGTSALWLNYTAVELITNSSPLFANYTGSVNLMELVNTSQIIAEFTVPKNVVVNQIRLFVSSAKIEINGTSYPVFLPSGVLKIPVRNATSGALVDLQPHIVIAYVGQTPEYILTPVATAIPYSVSASVGQKVALPSQVVEKLRSTFSNLTVVSSSLTFEGNTTSFSITIKNNGDEPVVVYAVKIFGEWQTQIDVAFNSSAFEGSGKGFTSAFGKEAPVGFNGTFTSRMPIVFFVYNNSLEPFPNAPFNPHGFHFFGAPIHMGPFNFSSNVTLNGSMINYTPPMWHGNFGIIIEPGQKVTLNYSGVITPLWHGLHFKHKWFTSVKIYTTPLNGAQYEIRLLSVPPTNSTYYVSAKEL